MDSVKVLEEKMRVAEKDIDGLRDDMDSIDDEVRKISNTVSVMNERQEELIRDIKMFNTNGGPPRCHERQVVIEGLTKAQIEMLANQKTMETSITTLQTTLALSLQKQRTVFDIQKWALEIVKAIVVGVVIAAIVAQVNSAKATEVELPHANSTVQVR